MPITFEHVKHVYSTGTPYQYDALQDINLNITENKITAIIGQTGSGKSTLIQHLNALLLPTEGTIHILDRTISAKETPKKLKSLRGDVGLVLLRLVQRTLDVRKRKPSRRQKMHSS